MDSGRGITNEMVVNAYSEPLTYDLLPDDVRCHVFGSKYTPGGEDADGCLPLGVVLTTEWPVDCHFTMYEHSSGMRLVKGVDHPGIRFGFCAADLDWDDHKSRPGPDDFANLLRTATVLEHKPNLVYATRGGARFLWLIDPLENADVFERHMTGLLKKTGVVSRACKYAVDEKAKDWTRLFRASLVVRDEQPEYGYQIRLLHTRVLDLLRFKAKPLPTRPLLDATAEFAPNQYIDRLTEDMGTGERNGNTFKAALRVISKYQPDAAERWLGVLRDRATSAGLQDREIDQVFKSAEKYLRRTGERT